MKRRISVIMSRSLSVTMSRSDNEPQSFSDNEPQSFLDWIRIAFQISGSRTNFFKVFDLNQIHLGVPFASKRELKTYCLTLMYVYVELKPFEMVLIDNTEVMFC
jgi:hypothetical protein